MKFVLFAILVFYILFFGLFLLTLYNPIFLVIFAAVAAMTSVVIVIGVCYILYFIIRDSEKPTK